MLVAEPIALELRQSSGDIYLHAQIFAGFMYIAAALCMWSLRSWKLGDEERPQSEREKAGDSPKRAFQRLLIRGKV